ncbi:UDP-glucose--hexose-1-phosphate uridylyltransferase [Sediminibacillus dalangtanensis]|uniref:Galactose-1-phosphate uridylyltransferase n=1 Tax=Sediminibacillus dalangtanensis TaxID=2729421 RepID=A0ABX7VY58_9BACI|nr:UDP-glucose--hexose-1-phosphate uridylyltransferase [Sediminibacillus dalangtanensis]QTN01005.1 UDP-glucose--hexose-1-phosphate uridylyltransferase [Sediminibacillus dalangtanensis]
MSVFQTIASLIDKAISAGLIEQRDTVYVRNQLLGLLKLSDFQEEAPDGTAQNSIPDSVEELVGYAVERQIIEDVLDEKEIFAANVMNIFLPKPSAVQQTFESKFQEAAEQATDYFYALSKNSNYIQMKRIRKNIHFKADTAYGKMDITINLSKPEKDPEQIRREKEEKQAIGYPPCVLCRENEGYVGRIGHPARSNHRIVKVPLQGENWYLQYSPYVYYNEHSIVLAEEHREMKIDRQTFLRLTAFVEKFPHYFLGSNADLPIVGGSILSHDHYQGGRYQFAMETAAETEAFSLKDFPNVQAGIVDWPLSVIRVSSRDRMELVDAADHILLKWRNYEDEQVSIKAYSGDTPHNTVTPIVRMRDDRLEMDIVLRNNRTSEQHPLGIFHPHADVHHIKRENIGLIEVMGLAVLPARLKSELEEVKRFLLEETEEVPAHHREWAELIKQQNGICEENVEAILQNEVGKKFTKVLEDAGVFKRDEQGNQAFQRFIVALNQD